MTKDEVDGHATRLEALGHRFDVLQLTGLAPEGWLIMMVCECETAQAQANPCRHRQRRAPEVPAVSIQAIAWVLDHSQAEGLDRLVLISLANHYNHQTGRCDPGQRRIAREARVDQTTVSRATKRLVALGELSVVRAGSGTRTAEYTFPWLVDNSASDAHSIARKPSSDAQTIASDAQTPSSDAPGRIETTSEPFSKPRENALRVVEDDVDRETARAAGASGLAQARAVLDSKGRHPSALFDKPDQETAP